MNFSPPDRFEFLFARLHPRGDGLDLNAQRPAPTWSFPASMDDAELARAAAPAGGNRCGHTEGVWRLAAMAADVAVPHMFCLDGMTTYRGLLDLLDIPFVGCDAACMALSTNKEQNIMSFHIAFENCMPCFPMFLSCMFSNCHLVQ